MNLLLILFLGGCLAWAVGVLTRVVADEHLWWQHRNHPCRSWQPRVPEQRDEAA